MRRKIIYDGVEVDCDVTFSYKLMILIGILLIGGPLYFTYIGAYKIAVLNFVLVMLGLMIGGPSAFMDFKPIKNNEGNENEE